MKKFLTLLAAMLMTIGMMAKDVTFTCDDTWSQDGATLTNTKEGVTVTVSWSSRVDQETVVNYFDFTTGTRSGTVNVSVASQSETIANLKIEDASVLYNGTDISHTFDLAAGSNMCISKITVTLADAPAVAPVTFSVPAGTYTTAQTVELSCATAGATIWYQTTGNWADAVPYTAPITVSETTTIYATAYKGADRSDDTSATYTIDAPETLNITLNSSGYATFSCKSNANISGAEAYKASVVGETITLTQLTGYIPAGTGVILYNETPSATVTMSVPTSDDAAADVSGNDLKATTKADGSLASFETNTWALGEGDQFLNYTGTAYIHNRAYLVHEKLAGAKAMRMVFAEGETTGIDATMIETATREGKFLDGSKIVIIKNGTKYNVAGQVIK